MITAGILLYLVGLVVVVVSIVSPSLLRRRRGSLDLRPAHLAEQAGRLPWRQQIEEALWQANWSLSPNVFFAIQGGAAIVLLLLGGAALGLGGAVLGAATGFVVPWAILDYQRSAVMNRYNSAFPAMLSVLIQRLRFHGANLPAALQGAAQSAPDEYRIDWLELAAAFSAGEVNMEKVQALVNRRASPFLQRMVAVLLARKDRPQLLVEDLTDVLRDIQNDAALLTKVQSDLQMPKMTLLVVGLGAPLLFVVLLFLMPSLRDFYVNTLAGNLMGGVGITLMLAATAWAYRLMEKKVHVLTPQMIVPERREASAFFGDEALGEKGGEA